MKWTIAGMIALAAGVLVLGTPFGGGVPRSDHHWNSPSVILPMTFAHADHVGQNCLACHHNYVDDTGDGACMYCHVADERVADDLEQQFHTLCMGCHVERQREGVAHGPIRRCVSCHVAEDAP